MNQKIATIILVVSAIFSAWIYWGSDIKTEQILTSQEWQSKMTTVIRPSVRSDSVSTLRRVDVTSNVKYLPMVAILECLTFYYLLLAQKVKVGLAFQRRVNGMSVTATC